MLVISTAVSQKKRSQGEVISMATAMVTEEKGKELGDCLAVHFLP